MIARLLSLLLLISATGSAAAHEFEDLVKAIERHYGAKRTHIPLMGAANLFVKVAHPAGTSGFKLALFDNFSLGDEDAAQLNRFMEAAGGSLHPTIRTHSRGGEATFLYTGEVGRSTRVLIATFERNQATVIEVNVSMEVLMKLIQSPGDANQMFGIGS